MANESDGLNFLRGAVVGLTVAKKDEIASAIMNNRYDDAVADAELLLQAIKELRDVVNLFGVHAEKGSLMINHMIQNFDDYRGE